MVLFNILLLGAIAEEFTGVPKKQRKFRLGLTEKEKKNLDFKF